MANIVADDALVAAMRGGDQAALESIIDRYTAYVGTIVWNILQGKLSHADAEEVVADSFRLLWYSADKVRPGKLKGYLAVIARRRALNALRDARKALPLEEDAVQIPAPGPEDELIRREAYAALRRTVDGLPEPDRTIFLRHYFFCQSTSEIAGVMGINVNTVQSKLRRGRENLRRELIKGGYFIGDENFGTL